MQTSLCLFEQTHQLINLNYAECSPGAEFKMQEDARHFISLLCATDAAVIELNAT